MCVSGGGEVCGVGWVGGEGWGGYGISSNAFQGDLAFLLEGFSFNSSRDWNYDEVIFPEKLPMSLVVSLGKFLKCIVNIYVSFAVSPISPLSGSHSLSLSSHFTCQRVNVIWYEAFVFDTCKTPLCLNHWGIWSCIHVCKRLSSGSLQKKKKNKNTIQTNVLSLCHSWTCFYRIFAEKITCLFQWEKERLSGTCQIRDDDSSETCGLISYFQEETYLIIFKLTSWWSIQGQHWLVWIRSSFRPLKLHPIKELYGKKKKRMIMFGFDLFVWQCLFQLIIRYVFLYSSYDCCLLLVDVHFSWVHLSL